MALNEQQAVAQARELKRLYEGERTQLDVIRRYWKGIQRLPDVIPTTAPREVRIMARISRVNVARIVVDSLAQSTFVDGFKTTSDDHDAAGWDIWQANKMDARQTGIHRAAFAYGASYAIVMPGDPAPVIRGVSPRSIIVAYEDDPDWPVLALEMRDRKRKTWRLYDSTSVYELQANNRGSEFDFLDMKDHGAGVCPIVRYLDEDDLDADNDVQPDPTTFLGTIVPQRGQITPLMPLQDQIDLTTFNLLVAQQYAAFRQRYIIGWTADDETQKMKAAASQLWTFDADKDEISIGEFEQTDLKGYIESRDATLRHAASLSQTPVHELIGDLVNLSAEALAAADAGRDRKVDERKTMLGEAHEQMLRLAARLAGQDDEIPDDAEVIWRDTSARSFAATVDALGKLVTMLGVPPEELWQRIPGVTQQDVERWKVTAKSGGAFGDLLKVLDAQSGHDATGGGVQ